MKTLVLSLFLLCSCDFYEKPISVNRSNNPDYVVQFLFEFEGVKVYSFRDNGRTHYFTNKGETISSYSTMCGKIVTTRDENIQ